MKKFLVLILLASAGCASSSSSGSAGKNAAPPEIPAGYKYSPPKKMTDPHVVEETATYYISRYPKKEFVKTGPDEVRWPGIKAPVKIYKEDADYYYFMTQKYTPEELQAFVQKSRDEAAEKRAKELAQLEAQAQKDKGAADFILRPEDFARLEPARASSGIHWERGGEGLPTAGQWRQNFAIGDINGDGNPDIVSPPPRGGTGGLQVFLGDGHGNFRPEKIELERAAVTAPGKERRKGGVGYGGVALADFNGDGRLDIATASHNGTVHVFLNEGNGVYKEDAAGLPAAFSSQAVTAIDVNGDGRPDLVVSSDGFELPNNEVHHQVRVYLNEGAKGWLYQPDALDGACFSYNVFPFSLSGQNPPRDILTGCRYVGGWGLTWKNDGSGRFSTAAFKEVEQAALHVAVAPGSFGKDHLPAFVDGYSKLDSRDNLNATGINVYYEKNGKWTKVPVWREPNFDGQIRTLAMGDLNGDGLDDVVFPDRWNRRVRIFFQTPEGNFVESPEALEPKLDSAVADVHLADLTHSGRLDIVISETVFSESPDDKGGWEVLLNKGEAK